ncbi:MAG: hypothetical protein Q9170_000786 [Blastenia crenularia]
MAPKRVPSSSGLPDNWTVEMDKFICYCDALGDFPVKVIIISLKKRFPELNMVALSESAIERRLFCLDRMDNDFFKKGSDLAVQRLESAGIRLPPEPKYGSDKVETEVTASQKGGHADPVTPEKQPVVQAGALRMVNPNNVESTGSPTARYKHDRYAKTGKELSITIPGRMASETTQQTIQHPVHSESALAAGSRGIMDMNHKAPTAQARPTNFRSVSDSSRHPKDVAPTASLSQLRVSEDNSQLEGTNPYSSHSGYNAASGGFSFGTKGRSNVPSDSLSQALSVNASLGFSSGSPRAVHGRVKPTTSSSNLASSRRQNDENVPLSASTPVNSSTEADGSTMSSRRYI